MTKGKVDNSKHSRGYCGFFTSSKGNRFYLRSLKEYIVAEWLSSLETDKITVLGEWYVGDYRPDFRVEINGKTRLVVEVKDNKHAAEWCLFTYKERMQTLGYRYIVIYKYKHFAKIIRKLNLDLAVWRENAYYSHKGELNPAHGTTRTEDQKRKIGDKTIERHKDPVYFKKWKSAHDKAMKSPETREKISKKQTESHRRKKEELDKVDPLVVILCKQCGADTGKKHRMSETIEENRSFCDFKCALKHYKATGRAYKFTDEQKTERFKKTLLEQANRVFLHYSSINEDTIRNARQDGIIRKNSQLSMKSIEKYFHNTDGILEVMNG